MELLKYEFKRSMKKPVIFLLIALIIFIGINVYTEMSFFNAKIKYNREITTSYLVAGEWRTMIEFIKEQNLKEENLNAVDMIDNLLKYAQNAVDSYGKGEYKEAYRDNLLASMLQARLFCPKAEEELLRNNIINIWDELLPEIEYDSLKFSDLSTDDGSNGVKNRIVEIKYRYDLFNKNIRYIDNYSLNNVTFTYNMIDKFLPIILCIVVVLVSFNSISDEYSSGVSKNIVTQPLKRSKYYMIMVFSNFLVASLIVIVTIIVLNIFIGFLSSFHSFDTPILTNSSQWNRLTIPGMDLREAYNISLQKSYLGPVEVSYSDLGKNLFSNATFISFSTFLVQTVGIFLLYTFFLTIVSVFISSIFRDKIKALITLIVINGIGYLLSTLHPSVFNVYNASNAVAVITGSSNLTILGSFSMLFISSLIVILIAITYLKRKDITY